MKKYLKNKLIAFIILALIVETLAGFFIYSFLSKNIKNDYNAVAQTSVDFMSSRLKTLLAQEYINVSNDTEQTNQGYFLESGKINFNNNVFDIINSELAYKIKNQNYTFCNLNDFFNIIESDFQGEACAIFSYYIDSIRYFSVKSLNSLFNEIATDEINYNNILSNTGRIIYSQNNFIVDNIKNINSDFFTQGYCEVASDNQKFIILYSNININDSTEYIYAGAINFSSLNEKLNNTLIGVIAILVALFIILLIIFIIFGVTSLNKKIKITKYEKQNSFYYFVKTDLEGNVKKYNKNFNNDFKITNLFSYIIVKQTEGELKVGDNIWVSCTLSDASIHIVNFIIIKKTKNFELIGYKEDKLLESKGELVNLQKSVDIGADFENTFVKCKNSGRSFLIGILQVINIGSIEIMFGRNFADDFYVAICQEVKKYFTSIFILPENKIGIVVTDDLDEKIKNLNEIFIKLNRPLRFKENLLKVDCEGAFVHVDFALANADYVYCMKCIEATLNRVKSEKKEYYYVYHESQRNLYKNYFAYDFDIDLMLKNNNFLMEFQPQYSLKTKKVVGFEALFRIKPSAQVSVKIYDFIVFAERTGKIMKLSEFIYEESMKFAKKIEDKNVEISLNVSPVQFMQDGFVASFLNLYKKNKLKNNSICIEITESFLVTNFDSMVNKLNELKRNGIKIHLDDFGTSYSSLMYIKKLPLDAIKIDKSFIDDITHDNYSYSIVKLIIDFTKQLNIVSIAEGIEQKEQKEILEKLNCDIIQGYLTGKSMPDYKALELLSNQ